MTRSLFRSARTTGKTLRVVLIKPSKYDDEGYVIRHFRGVLPSNTLACLASLTRDVAGRRLLGDIDIEVELFDDTVEKIPVRRIIRSHRLPRTRTVIALAGVQSNQFPRAADLARKFRAGGCRFSSAASMSAGCWRCSRGVARNPGTARPGRDRGERGGGGNLGDLLRDAAEDRLRPLYDFMDRKPDLTTAPSR